ncbi:TPA: hypothetical protein ACNIJL_003955 [Pseudomonas aeruginosa]
MEARLGALRRGNASDGKETFATRWGPMLLVGLLVYGGYRAANQMFVDQLPVWVQVAYGIPIYYGPAALLLLAAFVLHRRSAFPIFASWATFDVMM